MEKDIRLIALDIDGTTLTSDAKNTAFDCGGDQGGSCKRDWGNHLYGAEFRLYTRSERGAWNQAAHRMYERGCRTGRSCHV